MSKTTFTGPIQSNAGFMTPVIAVATSSNIDAGANIVINSESNGGPAAPITLTLPTVSGAYGSEDPRYNGIRGGIWNGSATITHLLDAGDQKINGSTSALSIPPLHFAEWIGNGNQNDPWLCRLTPLVSASV